MIPKRAIFFWEGPEMSWLRQQSVATFRALNPEWEIVTINGAAYGDPRTGRMLETAHRSDRARYAELAERGGVYFDTDIVFFKPFPEVLLRHDQFLPLNENGKPAHIAMLGCVPGAPYYSMLSRVCDAFAESGKPLGYQSLGLSLVVKFRPDATVAPVEWDLVVPVGWEDPVELWREPVHLVLPERCFGVHWYGGDRLSQEYERIASPAWADLSQCLVASCLKQASVPA